MNICHVENLNSIKKLEKLGFVGCDVSLEVSLFEYGLAWKDLGEEILFIYKVSNNRFDRQTIANSIDITQEFDWVDWDAFLLDSSNWIELSIGQKISNLVSYYGTEEIFGSSYWEGFEIKKD